MNLKHSEEKLSIKTMHSINQQQPNKQTIYHSQFQHHLQETLNILSQSTPQQQQKQQQNGKFFNLADIKPFDLKPKWLTEATDALEKYKNAHKKLQTQKQNMKANLKIFHEHQNAYRISSLRKINFTFDKKAIYQEFIKKTRKPLQKLHPTLIINIFSYIDYNVFLSLAKYSRISKIFNFIYKSEQLSNFLIYRELGISIDPQQGDNKQLLNYEKNYLKNMYKLTSFEILRQYGKKFKLFAETMNSYKALIYCNTVIPIGTFLEDLQSTIQFINEIFKLAYIHRTKQFSYYRIVNSLIKKNRFVIGLSSLSLTQYVLIRKIAIIAFSNYLALNHTQRTKQQISKTQYLKVIEVAQEQDYRQSLIVNTKMSSYLKEGYDVTLGMFIAPYDSYKKSKLSICCVWDIILFHLYEDQKTKYYENSKIRQYLYKEDELSSQNKKRIQLLDLELEFKQQKKCNVSILQGQQWQVIEMNGSEQVYVRNEDQFVYGYFYSGKHYYLIMLAKQNQF